LYSFLALLSSFLVLLKPHTYPLILINGSSVFLLGSPVLFPVILYSFLVLLRPHTSYLSSCLCNLDILSSIPRHPVHPNWLYCPPNLEILSIQPEYPNLPIWISYTLNLNIISSQPGYPILPTQISCSFPWPRNLPSSLFFYVLISRPFVLLTGYFDVPPCSSVLPTCPLPTPSFPQQDGYSFIELSGRRGGGYEYENSIVPILLKVRSPIQIYVGRHI